MDNVPIELVMKVMDEMCGWTPQQYTETELKSVPIIRSAACKIINDESSREHYPNEVVQCVLEREDLFKVAQGKYSQRLGNYLADFDWRLLVS